MQSDFYEPRKIPNEIRMRFFYCMDCSWESEPFFMCENVFYPCCDECGSGRIDASTDYFIVN